MPTPHHRSASHAKPRPPNAVRCSPHRPFAILTVPLHTPAAQRALYPYPPPRPAPRYADPRLRFVPPAMPNRATVRPPALHHTTPYRVEASMGVVSLSLPPCLEAPR